MVHCQGGPSITTTRLTQPTVFYLQRHAALLFWRDFLDRVNP